MSEYRNSLSVNPNHLTATSIPIRVSTPLICPLQCLVSPPLAPLIIPSQLNMLTVDKNQRIIHRELQPVQRMPNTRPSTGSLRKKSGT